MTATPKGKLPAEPYRVPGPHGVALAGGWLAACKPRERPPLSKFMAEHARSDDGARIRPFPFQADIADAFTDPETAQLSVRKSSRIGYSTILQCFVAWRIKYDPARTLIYQPTIDDAEKFSRDDLDPVLQWPIVRSVATFKPRHADNQIRAKRYKGGWIQIKGANKPTWNGGSGAIRLTKGGGTITGGVTYSIGAQQNIASLTLNGATFSFAGLTADTGQFVINAIFNGIAYSRVISVKKVRDGSAAFRSEAPFSANSNAASGTGNTTVPQARTVSAIIIAALLAAVIWSFQRAVS